MQVGNIKFTHNAPFFLVAGPCVIESEALVMEIAEQLKQISDQLALPIIFKASFDKANRTSHQSFRGLGMQVGLEILSKVRRNFNLPILTDVHAVAGLDEIADVVDVLQVPAFLCRQTDLLEACALTNKVIHVKKGQFLAPQDMRHVVAKLTHAGAALENIILGERGATFGYGNLVVDMRALAIMRQFGTKVMFDATHSVQLPGQGDGCTLGQREFIPVLARAAMAVGIDGLFMETHPRPDEALSDGPNCWPLHAMLPLLKDLLAIANLVKSADFTTSALQTDLV